MVRVIAVHNFLGQNITQIEEPIATCTAISQGKEMLLLALPTHCVEVWELMNSDIRLYTVFPTVDMINQMIHCTKGNYIVTLESKYLRDIASNNHANKTTSTFVRIYVNWAVAKDQRQPMRARIAGRVTPSLNRPLNSLEMIELPLSEQPSLIACCQSTGNLLIASGGSAILHEFKVETQQVSKLKFIDFEPRPWSFGFTFVPTYMEIVEDFIAIMNNTDLCIFRLTNSMYEDINQLNSLASTSSSIDRTSTDSSLLENIIGVWNDDGTIDNLKDGTKGNLWSKLQTDYVDKVRPGTNEEYIDWENLICNEKQEMKRLCNKKLVSDKDTLTANLPSITLGRIVPGHTFSPFILKSEDVKIFTKTTSSNEGWSENYKIHNLLRLTINVDENNVKLDRVLENFKCLAVKPLYMKKACNNTGVKKSMSRSDKYRYLQGVSCFICTMQEGYLYYFSTKSNSSLDATCLTTYPFTAPVRHIVLQHTVLHALTETGLESYTLRLSHHIAKLTNRIDNKKVACPSINEPVCLIGLRQFLGIQRLLHTRNYIVLLAKDDNCWTMYSLNLPKLENVYIDMLNAARHHKSASPSIYRHLLGEAHTIARLATDVLHDDFDNDEFMDTTHDDAKLKDLYKQSCALLADYYIRSETESDWDLCIPYYKMSGLTPAEVLSRKCSQDAPGLLTFLSNILLTMNSGSEADALFQGYNVTEMISKLEKEDLLKLIFGSYILREYTTEKLINLLFTHEIDDNVKLALAILYIQADRQEQAEKMLESVSEQCIEQTVLEHWLLLIDVVQMNQKGPVMPTFSDFTSVLMLVKSCVFANILVQLIRVKRILFLHQVIQWFLEYLPSRVGRDGHSAAATLELFLEKYLQDYCDASSVIQRPELYRSDINDDPALIETFKLLVRSYLGKLTQTKIYNTESKAQEDDKESFMFAKMRLSYLDRMPPYAKDYQEILNTNGFKDLSHLNTSETEKIVPKELYKLQCMLSCHFLPAECLHEVKQFLETQDIEGSLSLKTLCNKNSIEVTKILVDNCVQAVLQYAKERYREDNEWKYLVKLIEDKITESKNQQELQCLYTEVMKEILNYLPYVITAQNTLQYILPKDDTETFQRCMEICTKMKHANRIKTLVINTGRHLLTNLKL